jgi:hypothetical protein
MQPFAPISLAQFPTSDLCKFAFSFKPFEKAMVLPKPRLIQTEKEHRRALFLYVLRG